MIMRGADHYRQAHTILAGIESDGALPPSLMIKVAEVHALLALVEVLTDAQPTVSVAHGTVVVRSRDDH
jgi:hypothetical protein